MSWQPWLRDCLIAREPSKSISEKKPAAIHILERHLSKGKVVEIPKLGVEIKPTVDTKNP